MEAEHRERKPNRSTPAAATSMELVEKKPLAAPPPPPPAKPGAALIEFSTESREDPNEGLAFGDMPERCTCPHCERVVVTFIDYEASFVTWILGFVVWISLGWMALWVLPLLWPAFKDIVHHCPRCLNALARKSRISLPTFRTEVMTCKIGNCAVVLARKYVIIFFALVAVIITVGVLRSTVHLQTTPMIEKGPPSMLTWEDFIFECGPRTALRQRVGVAKAFDERFRHKTFTWQGEVRAIREGFEVFFLKTKSILMVNMYPQRFPRREVSDVALIFGDDLNTEVALLNVGDWLEFEATMTAHGYHGDPEVMTLWHVKVIPKPSPLSSSAGSLSHHPQALQTGNETNTADEQQGEEIKEPELEPERQAPGGESLADAV